MFKLTTDSYEAVGPMSLVCFIAKDIAENGGLAAVHRASADETERLPRLGGVAVGIQLVRYCNKCGYPVPYDGGRVTHSAYYDCPRCWPEPKEPASEPEEGLDYWLAVEDAHR